MPVARAFAEVSQAQSGPGPGFCINLLGIHVSLDECACHTEQSARR